MAETSTSTNFNPELHRPLNDQEIKKIRMEPMGHEEELEAEGATVYDFDRVQNDGDKWHDTSGRTKEEIRELADTTDSGALTLPSYAHTINMQFRIEVPDGASKKCTCNSCWSTFWIAPFSDPGECPFCHERGFNIATERVIADNE